MIPNSSMSLQYMKKYRHLKLPLMVLYILECSWGRLRKTTLNLDQDSWSPVPQTGTFRAGSRSASRSTAMIGGKAEFREWPWKRTWHQRRLHSSVHIVIISHFKIVQKLSAYWKQSETSITCRVIYLYGEFGNIYDGNWPLGRHNIEKIKILKLIKIIGYESVDWIHLAEDNNQWRAVMNTVIILRGL
jgi:hypothetical protein